MSQNGQPAVGAIVVRTTAMPAGLVFDRHQHPVHQLAWGPSGVLTVGTSDGTWMLPPTRALWIPAGLTHTLSAASAATARNLYFQPERCPLAWAAPTVVGVDTLLGALFGHLARPDVADAARGRAEQVVFDLLRPLPATMISVTMPVDDRARAVADALRASPADPRGLAAWGRVVGASGRTLTRIFLAETGMSFGRWRTQVRLEAAVRLLAGGTPVGTVARRVGYGTTSAFVATFRRFAGVSPAKYFASAPG